MSLRMCSRKLLRRLSYDLHRLPAGRLTLRDLDFDLPYLVSVHNPNIIDVGANKGQLIQRARLTWSSPRIWALEANPRLAADLQSRYASSEITVEPVAAGSVPGTLDFHIFENNELSSFLELEPCEANPFVHTRLSEQVAVRVVPLDAYVKDKGITRVDLLKIDTQGFDLEVLRGATGMLRRGMVESILVEVNFIEMYRKQCTFGEIERWLAEHGYGLLCFYEVVRRRQACISWATACFRRL